MTIGARIEMLVETLGGHASGRLGLDLDLARDRARWLAAARLLSERDAEERALGAARRLDTAVGTTPEALAAAGVERVAAALSEAGLRRAAQLAHVLCRAAASLAQRYDGDLERLAAGCLGLEELGSRLVALAPGLGTASVLRFLRPLRGVWSAARETPLAETAHAAAMHLGLSGSGADLEGEPSALRAACARHAPRVAFLDVEAALERLGARSCRSGRSARCPLGDACPLV
jgi:hypothetical protein